MDIQSKSLYMGEDIETLPREKLLECIDCLLNELDSAHATVRSIIELNKLRRHMREKEREAFWDRKTKNDKVHLFTERT